MGTPQPPQPPRFGDLLRRRRIAAGLTQEQLAERARLSARAISDLERGVNRTPQPGTLDLLADALALSAEERVEFAAAARRHGPLSSPLPADTPAPPNLAPPATALATTDALPPEPQRNEVGASDRALPLRPLLAAPLALLKTRGKLIAGLLVIGLLAGTLFSAGAAAQHARLPGGTLCIATDLPVSGGDGPAGKPVENAVNLAVQQNRDLGSGYRLRAINYDDESATGKEVDTQRGASNMAAMVKNPCVVGMVGPYNSHVAPGEMVIAASARLVMISPANTNPGLTLRSYADDPPLPFDQMHPAGKKTNYFRDIASDAVQGKVGADFMFGELGSHSAYVIADRTAYGDDIASGFTREFLNRGGGIIGLASLPFGNLSVIAQDAAIIAASRPEGVYFAGVTSAGAGSMVKDLAADGYTGPFVSDDGIAGDPTILHQAGDAAKNTYASLPGPDISTFASGAPARFLRDYHARYPDQPVDGYSANAYDAAMALITSMRNLIRAGQHVTRAAMIDQIQNIHYQGITGLISFDTNGDDAHGQYTILQVQNGAWTVYEHVTL